jgi:hypothetical protein
VGHVVPSLLSGVAHRNGPRRFFTSRRLPGEGHLASRVYREFRYRGRFLSTVFRGLAPEVPIRGHKLMRCTAMRDALDQGEIFIYSASEELLHLTSEGAARRNGLRVPATRGFKWIHVEV